MDSHTEKGGISYGYGLLRSINFSWPFATLTADAEKLVVRISVGIWRRTFVLERASILAIREKRGFLSKGIIIEHEVEGVLPHVLFWSLRHQVLRERLEELGYRVSGG
ncbi:MAG: hypothetical protein EOP88_02790 [Verrucomicrobiaceae bacterium]|nr:MAG: hypothetical protein EOP88_02790 [Verrucomicrobiaceae bacterium]